MCFLRFHSRDYFGLCCEDYGIAGIRKKDWNPPSKKNIMQHAKAMQHIFDGLNTLGRKEQT